MNDEQIKEMIRLHEGYVPTVYLDTVKVPTANHGGLVMDPVRRAVFDGYAVQHGPAAGEPV